MDLVKIDYDNKETINTIKATVAKGATDSQLAQFLFVCKATGLNPFLKEIWCIPSTNTIMTSRDGYLKIANNDGMFDGIETKVIKDENGNIVKATCTVWRKDRSRPTYCEADFGEYFKKGSKVWEQYPSAMIMKVAEALALKRSFAINGLVTQEEIAEEPQALTAIPVQTAVETPKVIDVQAEPVDEKDDEDEQIILQLKYVLDRIAEKQGIDKDAATKAAFGDETGKMTFAKIEKLHTKSQMEKAKEALAKATKTLLGAA